MNMELIIFQKNNRRIFNIEIVTDRERGGSNWISDCKIFARTGKERSGTLTVRWIYTSVAPRLSVIKIIDRVPFRKVFTRYFERERKRERERLVVYINWHDDSMGSCEYEIILSWTEFRWIFDRSIGEIESPGEKINIENRSIPCLVKKKKEINTVATTGNKSSGRKIYIDFEK